MLTINLNQVCHRKTLVLSYSAPPHTHTWARISIVVGHKEWDEEYDLCEK